MTDINKKVTFYIDGATVDDVASTLEELTQDVLGHNHRRHFKVGGGHWIMSPAQRLPLEEGTRFPRRTEIVMNASLWVDDPEAAGLTGNQSNMGPYIRFLASLRSSSRVKVIALAHNWRWLPPTLQAYFDKLVATIISDFKAELGASQVPTDIQPFIATVDKKASDVLREISGPKGLGALRLGQYDSAAKRIASGEPACCVFLDWFEKYGRSGRFASDRSAQNSFRQAIETRTGTKLPRLEAPPCEHKTPVST